MTRPSLRLRPMEGEFAVARLAPDAPVPGWAGGGVFSTVSRTAEELSVLCEAARVPPGVRAEAGWRGVMLQGPFDFALTGVLASVLNPLADAGIGIFAVSTFDTDYVFVKGARFEAALNALRAAGHTVLAVLD